MVIASSVRTTSHRDHPSWVRHLIVYLAKCWSHLVRERTGNDHDIGLTWRSTEDYTESILIVPRGTEMHHFDGTAGEAEGHGPQRRLTGPVGNLIKGCSRVKSQQERLRHARRELAAGPKQDS